MTSRCVTLYDHTSNKSEEELLCSCITTLANGGAYLLIDAINPDGTLERPLYDRLSHLDATLKPFKQRIAALRPEITADIGLYFSMASHVRRDHNGTSLRAIMDPANNMLAASDLRPVQELLGTSIVLNQCKVPYRVLTDHSTDFSGLKAIILNDASFMSAQECDRIRKFVNDGGTLIATGMTSHQDIDGNTTGDFALKDVMGVSFAGRFSKKWNYLVPENGEMVSCNVPCPLVNATTATVLARVSEPIFDPEDFEHFASYHSNPPGPVGDHAALSVNRFGKGTCVYLYSSCLAMQNEAQQAFGGEIIRKYAPSSLLKVSNAPNSVEVTLLRSTQKPAYLLSMVNYQEELPNIPVHDIEAVVRLPDNASPVGCRRVSDGKAIDFKADSGRIVMKFPRVETVEMIEIDVKEHSS
jgi:hypothetical protein